MSATQQAPATMTAAKVMSDCLGGRLTVEECQAWLNISEGRPASTRALGLLAEEVKGRMGVFARVTFLGRRCDFRPRELTHEAIQAQIHKEVMPWAARILAEELNK